MNTSLFGLPWQESLREIAGRLPRPPVSGKVHLVTKNLFPFDAISRYLLEITCVLEATGVPCELYMQHCHELDRPRLFHVSELSKRVDHDRDLIFYHYSIGDPYLDVIRRLPVRKMAYYYGITPPALLEEFSKEVAIECRDGRRQASWLTEFDVLLFASRFTMNEFVTCCAQGSNGHPTDSPFRLNQPTLFVPPFLSMSKWETLSADFRRLHPLQDGQVNVLYVGRQYPHKRIEDVLRLFAAYHCLHPNTRLILAGTEHAPRYREYLCGTILPDLGKAARCVVFLDGASDGELKACYTVADFLIIMSEHEGFGVPLVEAMKFGVPIIAYASTAVPETLLGAGLSFKTKDFAMIASSMNELQQNLVRRGALIERQRLVYETEYRDEINMRRLLEAISYAAALRKYGRRTES